VSATLGYDLWASEYDRFDNPMVALASLAFAEAKLTLAGSSFLDVGCGTGRNLALAKTAGAAILVGIDGSRGMLAQASATLGDSCTLVEADLAGTWPLLPDAPFDIACVSLVLEHFERVLPAVAQIGRHLEPGGLLFVAEMHADLARSGTGAHFEKSGTVHRLPSFAHDAAEFAQALSASGFAPCDIAEWPADRHAGAIKKLEKHRGKNALTSFVAQKLSV